MSYPGRDGRFLTRDAAIELFLDPSFDVNCRFCGVPVMHTNPCSPLSIAAAYGLFDIAKNLLLREAKPDTLALFMACLNGHNEIVHLLLAHGANAGGAISAQDRRTPIWPAVSRGNVEIARTLLVHGADPFYISTTYKRPRSLFDIAYDIDTKYVLHMEVAWRRRRAAVICLFLAV